MFGSLQFKDGKLALDYLNQMKPEDLSRIKAVFSDYMMPNMDGFTLAEEIRNNDPDVPLFFLSAKSMKEDILNGYKLGADDYITKPFDADELVLRIRNILKRSSAKIPEVETLAIGNYTFYPKELLLQSPSGRRVLTEREAELLQMLTENMGQLVRKRDILNRLWKENDFFNGRSMDVFVSRLRKYLSDDPRIMIESVRGAGIRLMINYDAY